MRQYDLITEDFTLIGDSAPDTDQELAKALARKAALEAQERLQAAFDFMAKGNTLPDANQSKQKGINDYEDE